MRTTVILMLLLLIIANASATKIAEVKIDGEINEGTRITVENAIKYAERNCDLLLIVINTPGGIFSSTQKIVQEIMNAEIPVVAYVPKGAISASAGTIILISADIAAMANGTAIGAATPVFIGEVSPEAKNKTINYIAEYVKGIARAKGRNAEVVEKFVREGLTLTAEEAYKAGVIDLIVDSESDLFKKLNGRKIMINGREVVLNLTSYEVVMLKKPINARIYEIISNPLLASILLVMGIYLLVFGLTSPGLLAETLGAICLVLALAGLGVVEKNLIGLMLIILGVLFLIAEVLTPTYGVLGAASVICTVLGVLMLIREPLMPKEFYESFPKFVVGVGVGFAGLMTFMIIKVVRIRKMKSRIGEVIGLEGEVVEFSDGEGFAKIRGEIWKIESDEDLKKGDRVVVIARDGLKLKVRRCSRKS